MEKWQLEQMCNLPLPVKIKKTEQRIREWYEYYNGDVYVSFSGGKDSTVLLHIARQIYPNIKAVYVDTGLEYPEVREFVKTFDGIEWLKPKMNFKQVIDKYGYPVISKEQSQFIYELRTTKSDKLIETRLYGNKSGHGHVSAKWLPLVDAPFKVSHKCCDVMKKGPCKNYEKITGRKPMIATMTCESALRKQQWLANGCNSFESKRPISKPMSFWCENDVLAYVKQNDLKLASVYGDIVSDGNIYKTTGCERTGCMFGCQNKEDNRFDKMKESHPVIYDYCMRDVKNGGLGLQKILEYVDCLN